MFCLLTLQEKHAKKEKDKKQKRHKSSPEHDAQPSSARPDRECCKYDLFTSCFTVWPVCIMLKDEKITTWSPKIC